MRFLIVDDSRAMQSIIKRILYSTGYTNCEIKTASDGKEALNVIREWKPDLVLTDWYMPVMDGMELMSKVQREMLDIQIGFITTETSEQRIAQAKEAGAVFVIQKPFESAELAQALAPLLNNATKQHVESTHKPALKVTPQQRLALPSASSFAKIANSLTPHEILVEAVPPINTNKKQLPCLVGLFDDGVSTLIRVVCVLELPAACVLGSAIANLTGTNAKEAIAAKTIEGPILDGCTQLLTVLSAAIYDVSNRADLQLRSVNVVHGIVPKLNSIYTRSENGRSDFEIAVLDYGQGLMTIITV